MRGVPSTMVKPKLPSEGSPNPSTTLLGMTVTAAPVSTFASIVRFCPVDGFSRLIYTYTCSYGALNFNRSMVPVFCSTFYNLGLGQFFKPSSVEIDIPKVWDDSLFFVHDCICYSLFLVFFLIVRRWRCHHHPTSWFFISFHYRGFSSSVACSLFIPSLRTASPEASDWEFALSGLFSTS